jgi:hypothetical protein
LLWFGGASVVVSLIIGLQVVAVPRLGADLGRSALLVPAWGVVSLLLAVITRRSAESFWVKILGSMWLLIGIAAFAWLTRA